MTLIEVAPLDAAAPVEEPPASDLPDLYCLLDCDNFLSAGSTDTEARHLLMQLIESSRAVLGDFTRVHFRLYGGWHENGAVTQRASQVALLMSAAFPLPMAVGPGLIMRGDWELSNSLLGNPKIEFVNTWRRRTSTPRLRLAGSPLPNGCVSDLPNCPASILRKITKSSARTCPTDGCSVRSNEMFITSEQKQVDTLLTVDLLEIASMPDEPLLVCVSDDTDFLPGLVAVSAAAPRVAYCNSKHRYDPASRQMLAELGIKHISIREARP